MHTAVSYKASTLVLFTLALYRMALSEFTSSIVTSLMSLSSQSESDPVSLSCIPLMSCLHSSME